MQTSVCASLHAAGVAGRDQGSRAMKKTDDTGATGPSVDACFGVLRSFVVCVIPNKKKMIGTEAQDGQKNAMCRGRVQPNRQYGIRDAKSAINV